MPECPDCGGELVVSADHSDSRGTTNVYECNSCNELFDVEEIEAD
ncbi:hypothetical protein ABSL23_10870 [Halobacterium sp. NMX12-1]|jgi:predicted RNA-binding Zn-ribbon protein involved in translation (DUF1610 family)|uniref:Small CPxCG-related zinc finger protein n=1 Tax=Halobacterium sp. NMX12-1 TaxID=3166650 RepID=A0AAU8CA60_9EURY